jgi:hypothetical protein
VIAGYPSDRGQQLVDGEGLLERLDIGKAGGNANRITGKKQEGHVPLPQLLGKGQARRAAKDEVENDDVRQRWTAEALAGALDGMFQGNRPRARGFEEILQIKGYDRLILDDQNRDIFELFAHAASAFSPISSRELSEAPEGCAFN